MWVSPLSPTDSRDTTNTTTFKYMEMIFILDSFSFSLSGSENVKNKSEILLLKPFL
jgi:hypothetical protein